jgi:hypothetical protein
MNLEAAGCETKIEEVAADKGYHKLSTLELADDFDFRTYIPEPKRRYRYHWANKAAGQQEALYANRRRMRGARGKRLQRQRSEQVERTFAHVCETGGGRRALLRGQEKVSKRYLIQVAARNLGLLMRKLFGIGTARSLQGLGGLFLAPYFALGKLWSRWSAGRIAVAIDFW